jgi:hypothetical protein
MPRVRVVQVECRDERGSTMDCHSGTCQEHEYLVQVVERPARREGPDEVLGNFTVVVYDNELVDKTLREVALAKIRQTYTGWDSVEPDHKTMMERLNSELAT